jgi:RNA polymerase sigma-70 factor (ECF subfamily)
MLGHGDAEDVVQEALARAWRARGSCETPHAPLGWMLRITRNEALRHLERRGKLIEREGGPAAEVKEAVGGPGLDALIEELSLEARLSRLRSEDRALLRLRYVHDLAHGEVARLLGVPEATVRVRLHRALERGRKVWGQRED